LFHGTSWQFSHFFSIFSWGFLLTLLLNIFLNNIFAWFNCAILNSYFYYLFDIMHVRENVFALCFLFHFLFCKYWCRVCICFIHFFYITYCWTTLVLHCIMYFSFCVDYFIMKSCLPCSFIFFVSFYRVGVACNGEIHLSRLVDRLPIPIYLMR
jgi:hypothetical protein